MNSPCSCTLQSTIERLLHSLIHLEQENPKPEIHKKLLDFFSLLDYAGCDFYDLLAVYAQISNFTEADLTAMLQHAPPPQSIYPSEAKYIRHCVRRWTASKYHTAPIADVLEDIEEKIKSGQPGLYTYNSNLNPYNHRSLNDLYVLILADSSVRWFDINRRSTCAFLQCRKETLTW